MSWPYFNADGSLRPFTTDEIKALKLYTADVKEGDHPTFELDSKGCSLRRMWFCDWTMRDKAIAYLLGAVTYYGTSPNYTLSRIMPQVFPDAGYEQYIALAMESVRGARSAGKDDAKYVPAYTSAKLNVRHEQVFWGLGADGAVPEYNRYVEKLPSTVETSYLTIPGSCMYYRLESAAYVQAPQATLIPYNVGRPEVMTRISYKWHRIPYEMWYPGSPLYLRVQGDPSKITSNAGGRIVGYPYIGTVSRLAFGGYPAGFMLFEGVEEELVPDPVRGFPCWNLTYKFLVKNVVSNGPRLIGLGGVTLNGGHNYLYYGGIQSDASKAGYYFATKNSTWLANGSIPDGVCLYNERSHENLFNVGAVADNDV